jgi:hypothetical protein
MTALCPWLCLALCHLFYGVGRAEALSLGHHLLGSPAPTVPALALPSHRHLANPLVFTPWLSAVFHHIAELALGLLIAFLKFWLEFKF